MESFKKQELLSTLTAKKLTTNEFRKQPQFHILPKIHKSNIPGRPVVSSVECHTSKISKFVDRYLKTTLRMTTILHQRHSRFHQ